MTNEKVREKIDEYINNKVNGVQLDIETVHDAHFTTLAYLQALVDAELITMSEYNVYYGTLIDRLYVLTDCMLYE